jgi:hypothetical protein
MVTSKETKMLLREYADYIGRHRYNQAMAQEVRDFDDALIRATGLAALGRLEKPTGNDADDWAELRDLTHRMALAFVAALEQAPTGSNNSLTID